MNASQLHTALLSILSLLLAGVSVRAQGGGPGLTLNVPLCAYTAFSHDGKYLMTASQDSLVRVWDAATGDSVREFHIKPTTIIKAVFLPGDSSVLVIGQNDSSFSVWNWRSGGLVKRVPVFRPILTADVSYDGSMVAIVVQYPASQIELWSVVSGGYLSKSLPNSVYANPIRFDYSGTKLTAFSRVDGRASIFDFASNTVTRLPTFGSDIFIGSISLDGKRLVCGIKDHGPIVFDVATLDTVASLDVNATSGEFFEMQYSPDGRWILGSSLLDSRTGGKVYQWDAATRAYVGELGLPDSIAPRPYMSFSYDSRYMVAWRGTPVVRILPLIQPNSGINAIAGIPNEGAETQVYPNPAHDVAVVRFHARGAGTVSVGIYNPIGEQVGYCRFDVERQGIVSHSMDLSSLQSGFYLCSITTRNGSSIAPLVVVR